MNVFFNHETLKHICKHTIYMVFFFQCKNRYFLEKVLNPKLVLFYFIYQMLFEMMLNVKNCVKWCHRGHKLAENAAIEENMMAVAFVKVHRSEMWGGWWWGWSFIQNRGSQPWPLQPTPEIFLPLGKEWGPGIVVFKALPGGSVWALTVENCWSRQLKTPLGWVTFKLGAAAVWRWFVLTTADSFVRWNFLSSDREGWRPPLGVAPRPTALLRGARPDCTSAYPRTYKFTVCLISSWHQASAERDGFPWNLMAPPLASVQLAATEQGLGEQ